MENTGLSKSAVQVALEKLAPPRTVRSTRAHQTATRATASYAIGANPRTAKETHPAAPQPGSN